MEALTEEIVVGFNGELYTVSVFDHGTHKEVAVSWVSRETGMEESCDVLKNDIGDSIEPVLVKLRAAIRCGEMKSGAAA